MGELLGELRRLQAVELELAGIRRNRGFKENRATRQRRQNKGIEDKLEANAASSRALQVRLDALALEVASREESTNKHRQALNRAKTNKEYAGILEAMNTEKADTGKIEATMLELMKEMETFKAGEDELVAERDKLTDQIAKSDAAIVAFDEQYRAERERLEVERGAFADSLPPAAMAAFTRASLRHDGEAMGTVVKPRPREDEYCCTGCNMKVTLEIVNSLHTRDEVQMCGSCGRILCLEDGIPSRSRA